MTLILRVDVDKPYGHHTLMRRVLSKLKEDYRPDLSLPKMYLSHLKEMLRYCNANGVKGNFLFRVCTIPDEETYELLIKGNHMWGMHLENSKSEETFNHEFLLFEKLSGRKNHRIFSKHGSGVFKLGKFHHPPYEPEKYKEWAQKNNRLFPSGNGIAQSPDDLKPVGGYFENSFWIETFYRSETFKDLNELLDYSENNEAVVLIHPSNFKTDKFTRKEFERLVTEAAQRQIAWKLFYE